MLSASTSIPSASISAMRSDNCRSLRKGYSPPQGCRADEEEIMAGSTKGGFHIGTVGGNASFSAGGDMVAGDKITQTTATTVNNGFKQDDDKQKFLQQIDELRATLRELQAKMAE